MKWRPAWSWLAEERRNVAIFVGRVAVASMVARDACRVLAIGLSSGDVDPRTLGSRPCTPRSRRDLVAPPALGQNLCARIATGFNTDAHEWTDLRGATRRSTRVRRVYRRPTRRRSDVRSGTTCRRASRLRTASARPSPAGRPLIAARSTRSRTTARITGCRTRNTRASRSRYCDGTETSPDLDPVALACARPRARR